MAILFGKKIGFTSRQGILLTLSALFMIALVFGAASFAYSQLRAPDLEAQESNTEVMTSKEIQKNTVPVHPEGFACRAYTDYLDASGSMEPGKTPQETYKEIEKLQKPVKEKVAEVEDEAFQKPFDEYFDFHKEYTFDLVTADKEADMERMETILSDVSEVCSTEEALESVPDKKDTEDDAEKEESSKEE